MRIISGQWRGRKLPVPDLPGLRPSGDRVRETLFNWLQGRVAGRRCLDLFAGTGALGLEAASRSAASVTLVERQPALCESLRRIYQQWPGGDRLQVMQHDAMAYLEGQPPHPMDLVFIDPPFDQPSYARCLQRLVEGQWLADNACLYLEHPASMDPAPEWSDAGFERVREKTIGEVGLMLLGWRGSH
ncbi:MAG: 16S rRNA (guanine(966)-N(2))-methyltransferase RsmD [Pseudomonadota bacterium]